MLVLVECPGAYCVFFLCGGREGGGVGLVGVLFLGWLSYCVTV